MFHVWSCSFLYSFFVFFINRGWTVDIFCKDDRISCIFDSGQKKLRKYKKEAFQRNSCCGGIWWLGTNFMAFAFYILNCKHPLLFVVEVASSSLSKLQFPNYAKLVMIHFHISSKLITIIKCRLLINNMPSKPNWRSRKIKGLYTLNCSNAPQRVLAPQVEAH